jgi:peptide chain release factor 2
VRFFLDVAKDEKSEEAFGEAAAKVAEVAREMAQTELAQLLGGPDDRRNAIVTLHPGAGGTEAQDWAEILLRMYLRWCDRRGYRKEILEYQQGEEAGVKSVTFTVEGDYAYGYMKAEWDSPPVRISPLTPTRVAIPLASVFVYPVDDTIKIEINEGPARRYLPFQRRWRPACQQNRFRRAPDASSHRHRRGLPKRALAA